MQCKTHKKIQQWWRKLCEKHVQFQRLRSSKSLTELQPTNGKRAMFENSQDKAAKTQTFNFHWLQPQQQTTKHTIQCTISGRCVKTLIQQSNTIALICLFKIIVLFSFRTPTFLSFYLLSRYCPITSFEQRCAQNSPSCFLRYHFLLYKIHYPSGFCC